ncbi:MAG TPA: GAF domain-containing SpoIIE family protein phosphatase [Thermoanaerobaculia bacterium]|jgi:sigma-B regulation protein RsbU (phosphoserine phosphatase)|nr:GAF domain-containing SpoIIE family protein phosphatase [Thermoanaerobaculia bacterium]
MPPVHRFAAFVHELQQLERTPFAAQGPLILDAFARHTRFDSGALYLRDARGSELRLAAKSHQCIAPEILAIDIRPEDAVMPSPAVVVQLQSHREAYGLLALAAAGIDDLLDDDALDDDVAFVRAGATFLSTLITNQRLMQETREGDFQLKYRLWELESLYDIGLSIASTLNVDELADAILFRMISLTNARRAALFLRDDTQFSLYRSFGEVREGFLELELSQELIREGKPLAFEGDSDCLFPDCMAYVAVPIKGSNDAVIGVLAAADRETRDGGIAPFEANELRLLSLFANQVAIALENARLHREALEKQAMERDLELAATIQRDILPKSIPQLDGIEIAALSRPARQVGGDYHAFFVRDGVITTLVADVAGKSMPAALLVSALHAVVQLLFAEGREIGEVATELNRHIHSWSAENKFITMIMVAIDPENETISYVNAGHNPGYLIVNGQIDTLKSQGLPIGILANSRYLAQTRAFPAGSSTILYSDGITEAEDADGEEFGNERLEALLDQHLGCSASLIRDQIADAVDAFVDEEPQKDDETIVIIKRT